MTWFNPILRGENIVTEESENQADLFSKDLFWPKLEKPEKWDNKEAYE